MRLYRAGLLFHDLAAIPLHADLLILAFQSVKPPLHSNFQPGSGDGIFLREIGQVGIEVHGA